MSEIGISSDFGHPKQVRFTKIQILDTFSLDWVFYVSEIQTDFYGLWTPGIWTLTVYVKDSVMSSFKKCIFL